MMDLLCVVKYNYSPHPTEHSAILDPQIRLSTFLSDIKLDGNFVDV